MSDTKAVDAAVAAAKDLPDLVHKLDKVAPDLAQQLTGKALLASKTPWGTLLTALIAYAAAKYGLGWDQSTDELVAGVGLLIGAYAMRWVTTSPISGILRKALPAMLLVVTLAACANQPAATGAPPTQADPLAALAKFTIADLQSASADAKAHNDKLASMCYDYLAAQLSAQGPATPQSLGAVTVFQKARDLQSAVNSGISQDFQINCAPLLSDVRLNLIRLGAIGAGAAATGGAAAPFLGALP